MSVYSDFEVDTTNPNSSWTIIYNQIADGAKILDIGCSSGYFDKKLRDEKNCIVDGIELDKEDAERARANCRTVIKGNIEDKKLSLESLDDDYDYILFIDVLEHLINPVAALKRVAKLLGAKGRIIVSIPNMANGSVRLQLLQGNFDYESEGLLDATHLHYYTADEIEKILKESGLIATKVSHTTFNTSPSTIDNILKSVGLKNTKEFSKYINSSDSLVYQYIIEISKSGSRAPLLGGNHAIKPKIDYEQQLAAVQADARRLYEEKTQKDNEIIRLSEILKIKSQEIDTLKHKLDSSFMNKARRKVGRVLRRRKVN